MKYIIDRIEGNIAICEGDDLKFVEINKNRLPAAAREGSTIFIEDDGTILLTDDMARAERIAEKMRRIWK